MIKAKLLVAMLLLITLLLGCLKEDSFNNETSYDTKKSFTITDLSYGTHSQQKIDLYLPVNRNSDSTKVFILIHGGG